MAIFFVRNNKQLVFLLLLSILSISSVFSQLTGKQLCRKCKKRGAEKYRKVYERILEIKPSRALRACINRCKKDEFLKEYFGEFCDKDCCETFCLSKKGSEAKACFDATDTLLNLDLAACVNEVPIPTEMPVTAPTYPAPVPTPTEAPVTAPTYDNFCPKYCPKNNTECSLSGNIVGTCFYSSSAQSGEIPNNDSQTCTCNKDGTSKFVCESKPFPGPTPAPVPIPTEAPIAAPTYSNFCPKYCPKSNTECSLTGNVVGTCFYSSSAQFGEIPNNDSQACTCNKDGTSKFVCKSKPFPGPTPAPVPPVTPTPDIIKNWCPETVPATGDSCALPSEYANGSCSFTKYENGKKTHTKCSCESKLRQFVCLETSISI